MIMNRLCLAVLLMMSSVAYAVDYECYEGVHSLFHGKSYRAYSTDDFVICHKLEKKHYAIKKGQKEHRKEHKN